MHRARWPCVMPTNQPLVPLAAYSQPPEPNTGVNPAAGSVMVPENVELDPIVPRSSIAEPLPELELRIKSLTPSVKRTAPLNGRIRVLGGFSQLLVVALRVPSVPISMCVVITCPSTSAPPVHGNVPVLVRVNDQSPATCAWVTTPPPPPTPKMLSVEVSQADMSTTIIRQKAIGFT